MEIETKTLIYLLIHGISTLGAIFAFVIRIESRMTRVETILGLCIGNPEIMKNLGHKGIGR